MNRFYVLEADRTNGINITNNEMPQVASVSGEANLEDQGAQEKGKGNKTPILRNLTLMLCSCRSWIIFKTLLFAWRVKTLS